ncbi:hypothetical protein ABGB18_00995 [Nonomuraea sp. B12E4]|uniref:hypothetical protein n=1 Tax=Nonomuraea sp. B12E4 TaxID=3153564 RepID=UPI00325D43A2
MSRTETTPAGVPVTFEDTRAAASRIAGAARFASPVPGALGASTLSGGSGASGASGEFWAAS